MFFPDNPDRAQRLQNLSNDISFIQQNIVQIRDNLQKQNADALAVLEQIATASGHQDLDAMIESAKGLMTPDQKKAMDDLAQKVRDRDANLDTAYKVAGGVAAIGTIIKFGPASVNKIGVLITWVRSSMFNTSLINGAAKIVEGSGDGASEMELVGLLRNDEVAAAGGEQASSGVSSAGVEAAEATGEAAARALGGGSELTDSILASISRLASAASEMAAEVATVAINVLKIFGTAALVLGVLASLGTIVADGITGEQQKNELVDKIHECCVRRFLAEKLNMQANGFVTQMSEAIALVFEKKTFQELVAAGTMTQATADQALDSSRNTLMGHFVTSQVIKDQDIIDSLKVMDKSEKYLHDDFQLDEILQWIKDHPQST